MKVLITGGAGYIGSHCSIELLEAGHDVVCVDDLANSDTLTIDKVRQLTGRDISFYERNILDEDALARILADERVDACIHFAGLKSVAESFEKPDSYYQNNVLGTMAVLAAMKRAGVTNFVFSSSAVVYSGSGVPFREDSPVAMPCSPYGKTKFMVEHLLQDYARADDRWSIGILRYFNPVGAHQSGMIEDNPKNPPNNLMPIIIQAASGKRACLEIFGGDYPTRDGTCIRDYIHIVDLARGHVNALDRNVEVRGVGCYNLGRGEGVTVLELVNAFREVNGVEVPHKVVGRRLGDVAVSYASVEKAKKELGWEAGLDIYDMVRDAWRAARLNAKGIDQTFPRLLCGR